LSQKLLLLPELGSAISGPNNDADKIAPINHTRTVLNLVSGKGKSKSGLESMSNPSSTRIVVNNLTASWTHVRSSMYY